MLSFPEKIHVMHMQIEACAHMHVQVHTHTHFISIIDPQEEKWGRKSWKEK